jgi:hypothetical protein
MEISFAPRHARAWKRAARRIGDRAIQRKSRPEGSGSLAQPVEIRASRVCGADARVVTSSDEAVEAGGPEIPLMRRDEWMRRAC